MGKAHLVPWGFKKYHIQAKKEDAGQCLFRDCTDLKEGNSCSYRWQAMINAKKNKQIYNDRIMVGKTDVETEKGAYHHPRLYPSHLKPRSKDEWNIDGPQAPVYHKPKKLNTIPPGGNFTKDRWPYWHNAHHIIPIGSMRDAVSAAADGDVGAIGKFRRAILNGGYNINRHVNMIILPMDEEVGRILHLPRHLILQRKGKSEKMSHKEYSERLRERLLEVLDACKADLDGEQCEEKDAKVKADSLERISSEFRNKIVEFGEKSGGAPLAELPGKS